MVSIARLVLNVRDVETRLGVTMNANRSLYIEEYQLILKLLGIISLQASVRCLYVINC
jgi:hypothetical protein